MVIIEFRSRLRADADHDAYEQLAQRMHALAQVHPGFLSFEHFTTPDGVEVSIEHFEDMASAKAWRANDEHVAAQQRGRKDFYAWYEVHSAEVVRSHEFHF